MVIGSILPWIEAILLHLGAKKVTTLEYAEVKNEHPQLNPITPEQLRYGNTALFFSKEGPSKEARDKALGWSI